MRRCWSGGILSTNQPVSTQKYAHKASFPSLPFLVLDFGLDVVNGVGRLHLEGDRLARQGLDEDLHLSKYMAG